MAEFQDLIRVIEPHPRCSASKKELLILQKTVMDDCPICLQLQNRCSIGLHPSGESTIGIHLSCTKSL